MAESVNKLTADEMREKLNHALDVIGYEGAGSIAEYLIDQEAEKATSEITDPKAKRGAELIYIRMVLDQLERAYAEELHVHETGEEPTYDAG